MACRRLDLPWAGTSLRMSQVSKGKTPLSGPARSRRRRRLRIALASAAVVVASGVAASFWLVAKANTIQTELTSATALIAPLKTSISSNDSEYAAATVDQLKRHTAAAKNAANDPLWSLASATPWLGANFAAIAEVARSADDVAALSIGPLAKVYKSLDWPTLMPGGTGTDLAPLETASPSISSAAHVVRISSERLDRIDETNLLPQVAGPLNQAREELRAVTGALDAASDVASIAPEMLGIASPRNYLLMIQNNAESRASGGIPGALAVLTVDNGKLSLGAQSSASELGVVSPTLPVDDEQRSIFSTRMGKFIQDVNLTPDFPTAGSMAQAMWEKKTGQRVDGVISIDPVALSFILNATGPVQISNPELLAISGGRLPSELNSSNVIPTLLSDVYAKIEVPQMQDAYFASVAQELFTAVSNGNTDPQQLLTSIRRGVEENRILLWSGNRDEQAIVGQYPLGGSIAGPSVSPAQFGVYFNDGTGAKMDYYVKRTVQLVKECPKDGYQQTTVRITSTNTAPSDAGQSLPAYVTGDGAFGVPPGSVQTNIVTYGPIQALVETAKLNDERTGFAPYIHSNRPVAVLAVRLAPGETATVEVTFTKIVQHTEPNVVVTPTVQAVKDVTLPTENAACS